MNKKAPAVADNRNSFAILGFCLGLVFVVIGIIIALFTQGLSFDPASLLRLLFGNPYLWILYILPLLFATVFGWAGRRADELVLLRQKTRKFAQQILSETRLYKEKVEELEQKQQQSKTVLEEMGAATQLQTEDLRSLELQLAQAEALNQALFQFNPLAAALLDTDQVILDSNQAFGELFGYPQAEICGEYIDDLICPAEQGEEARQLALLVRDGEMVHAAALRRTRDGRVFDAEIFGLPVKQQGVITGILALYRDASQPLSLPMISKAETGAGVPAEPLEEGAPDWVPDENIIWQELDGESFETVMQDPLVSEVSSSDEPDFLSEMDFEQPGAAGQALRSSEQQETPSIPEEEPAAPSANWEPLTWDRAGGSVETDGSQENPPKESDSPGED